MVGKVSPWIETWSAWESKPFRKLPGDEKFLTHSGYWLVSQNIPCLLWLFMLSYGASLMAQTVKNLPAMRETWVQSPGWEDPLEKEMATHSSILAWRIPWTEEPGRLQSKGSKRAGQEWVTNTTVSYTESFNVATVKLVNLFLFVTSGFYDWEELSYSQIIKVVP